MHQIQKLIEFKNSQPLEAFSGLSPTQMHNLLYDPFSKKSPIQISNFNETHSNAPIFRLVLLLLDVIKTQGELKLTPKGALPNKIVEILFNSKIIHDDFGDIRTIKQYSEHQFFYATLTRIICELSPFCKKRNNKLSTTKAYDSIASQQSELFSTIFNIYTSKFNWAYLDGYDSDNAGQFGIGFSIYLILKSNSLSINPNDVVGKFLKAFPTLNSDNPREFKKPYENRISHFIKLFGLVNNEQKSIEDHLNNFLNPTWKFNEGIHRFFKIDTKI